MTAKPSSALDGIVAAYVLEHDLLRVARNVIDRADVSLMGGTRFIGRAVNESREDIARLRKRLDEMTVLAMWSTFERFMISHVVSLVTIAPAASPPFDARLRDHVEHQLEFSKFDDLLELYKGSVDKDDIGRVRQIKQYRDWISHRNPKRLPPAIVHPVAARAALGDVMDQIG
jgi:hypothetical protein